GAAPAVKGAVGSGIRTTLAQELEGALAKPFFSQTAKTIENSPITTGHPRQWEGGLRSQPGIKQEELDWLGVPEYLQSQQGPVTKQQLTDYVNQNKVD